MWISRNKCFVIIVVLSIVIAAYGMILSLLGYDIVEEGGWIAMALNSIPEGIVPWELEPQERFDMDMEAANYEEPVTQEYFAEDDPMSVTDPDITENEAAAVGYEEILSGAVVEEETNTENVQPAETGEAVGEETEEPEEEGFTFITVTEDYFADAVFIGDSRVDGFGSYGGLSEATYYAKPSMSIYNMMTRRINLDKDTRTVQDGLMNHQFGKVYIMVGINEIGTGNTTYFINHYKEVIAEIREMQPNALIYVMAIMHVGKSLSDTDPYFNNPLVNERNEGLQAMAEEEGCVYIDLNEVYDDEEGNLPAEMTRDQVHLYARYYSIWHDFMLTHAVEWDSQPEAVSVEEEEED